MENLSYFKVHFLSSGRTVDGGTIHKGLHLFEISILLPWSEHSKTVGVLIIVLSKGNAMKRTSLTWGILLLAVFLSINAVAVAAVPPLITYQGLLADTTGNPANGLFLIQFRIYDVASGGAPLWDNSFRTIQVTEGLLTYTLGDSTAFPANLFDGSARWLGIRVGTDLEISPRKQLVASAYSLHSAKSDSVGTDADYVHVAGDEMNGNLTFDIGDDADNEIILYTTSGRGQMSLLDNGNQRMFLGSLSNGGLFAIQDDVNFLAQLTGDNTFGGTVTLAQADGATGASLAGGTDAAQSALRLFDNAGAPSVTLLGNSTGDAAAVLPSSSVNSTEILDNTISAADIGADAVGSSEIVSGGVIGGDIADGTIMNVDVGVGAIDGTRIADNTLSGTDITDGTLNSADIANNTLTTDDILDNTLTATDIATGGVGSAEILDGSVALIDLSGDIVPSVGSTVLSNGSATIATPTTLDSFTVTVPGTGYLLVTVSGQYYFDLDALASTSITESGKIGLCTTPASEASCAGTYQFTYYQDSEDASPTAVNKTEWFTLQHIIPVIGSSYTFYVNGEATTPTGYDLFLYQNPKATALFVPGTLTVSSAPKPPANGDQNQVD